MMRISKCVLGAVLGAVMLALAVPAGLAGADSKSSQKQEMKKPKKSDQKGPKPAKKGDRGQGEKAHAKKHQPESEARFDSDGRLVSSGLSFGMAREWAQTDHLVGYTPLPPGIRKNLARGKPLPPGIAKKVVPPHLLQRLPVHPGYEWCVLGSDLALVAVQTMVIADILEGVFD